MQAILIDKADKLCDVAERLKKWDLVIQANALRAKAKEKRKAAEEATKYAEAAEKRCFFLQLCHMIKCFCHLHVGLCIWLLPQSGYCTRANKLLYLWYQGSEINI